jgi:hypothetical protein
MRSGDLRDAKLIAGVCAQCIFGHELLGNLSGKAMLDST